MNNARAPRPRLLIALTAAFIFLYHLFFTFDGFNTVFGGDDGMNLLHLHHHWEWPFRRSLLDALQVITPAYRPAGALFYRSLYQVFGYAPPAFRIAIFCMLVINLWLVYVLARKLDAPRSAAALTCLLFSYHAALMDLQYNTGTIYDVLCFLFYIPALILYIQRRSAGATLRLADMALIVVLYGAALDSKELAVTLPAALLLYEVLYRRPDFRSRSIILRQALFLCGLFVLTAFYSMAKVTEMSSNDLYRPRPSIAFVLGSMGHFLELFLYRTPDSYTLAGTIVTIVVLLGLSLLVRSRAAVFGTLYFFGALVPVALIPHRGGFAAYVAFPGLALAAGCILDGARRQLVQALKVERHQQAIAIAMFLVVAAVAGKYHLRVRNRWIAGMQSAQHPVAELMELMRRQVPDFPPDFRILLTEDAFPPHDWILFFLTRMRYGDQTVWLDRPHNLDQPPDLASYDLLMNYQPSVLESAPMHLFGVRLKWEPRVRVLAPPILTIDSGRSDATVHPVHFSPDAVRAGQSVTVTVPGIGNSKIDVVYRLLNGAREQVLKPANWCALDAASSCTVKAPEVSGPATLVLDWVRPHDGKWERTSGSFRIE